ncbi:hypothetical protein QBC36DRAFT_342552 [Triangularia setosa]|uniref:Nephrocystin 3-like N-terminal domain-containing protein n=1 Tax=Triangularia setosa TaxID=2587417 RepID=A0AAN6WI45_9PEZI|nr:hypothetical protein QBC36DRAFT_342552 [Podospora setosa]
MEDVAVLPNESNARPEIFREYRSHIINSLYFGSILRCEEDISQPHKATCRWGGAMWSSFPSWLEDPLVNSIYWIKRKPGAGKPTLMKYIVEHPTSKLHLQQWPSEKALLSGTVYFWNAGDEMQKSREGLLQTLLHPILKQIPGFTPTVCPRKWALPQILGASSPSKLPKWKFPELMEAFIAFEGNHGSVFELIRTVSAEVGTKIIFSSRLWNIFRDQFDTNPSLKVERLTELDIRTFVNSEFEQTKGYIELRESNPKEAERLVSNIISKAQGVFLRVNLVVRELCVGFREGNRLSDL